MLVDDKNVAGLPPSHTCADIFIQITAGLTQLLDEMRV